jgi:hypothetical protein
MAKEKARQWVGWNDLTMFGDFGIDHLRHTLSGPSQQSQRLILTELARANVALELRELAQEAGRLQKAAERLAGVFRSPGSVPAQSEGDFLTISGWIESVIESYAYCLFILWGQTRTRIRLEELTKASQAYVSLVGRVAKKQLEVYEQEQLLARLKAQGG